MPNIDPKLLADMLLAQAQGPVQLISNMHGPVGTFNSRQEALNHAKQMGIPVGPASGGSPYFIKPIPIAKPSG